MLQQVQGSDISRGGADITKVVHVVDVYLRMKMTSFPHFFVFLGVLLLILCRERCCGQSGYCANRYCSHNAMYICGSGGLVRLPCVVYNATGPIQVRWYHSQGENPADAEELNITTGDRYAVEESEQSPSNSRYENCTEGDQLYRNTLIFRYNEADSGSYWCRIVIGGGTTLELSEPWTVLSNSGPAICGAASQTDSKCAAQIAPTLALTTLLVQSTRTSVVRTTSVPSVSGTHSPVETNSPDCRLGEVSCVVYLGAGLGAGLGALVVIVALLVVVVIALVHISLKIRKKKRKGENNFADSKGVKSFKLTEHQQHPATVSVQNIGYVGANISKQGLHKGKDKPNEYEEIDQVDEGKVSSEPHQLPANLAGSQTSTKSCKEKMHPYDVVAQPIGDNSVPNDQQHIYDETQHLDITNKTQQTHGEYNQDSTTGHSSQYECLDSTRQGSRKKEARSEEHDYDSVSERGKHHRSGTPSSQENLYHVLEGPTEENSSATTAAEDMYSTPNVSSKRQPQTPVTQDNFYHVLGGPTPPAGISMYSNPERSTAPGKEEEHKYDEPVRPNWDSNKSGQKLGGELFDDPSYQSKFAPVISTQPHTQKLPNSARVDSLPSPPTTSSVEDKAVTSDPSYQLSSPSRPPTASRPTPQPNLESKKGAKNDTHAFSQDSKNAQEDDYDQPATITIKNKELDSNEGGDQPVLL